MVINICNSDIISIFILLNEIKRILIIVIIKLKRRFINLNYKFLLIINIALLII